MFYYISGKIVLLTQGKAVVDAGGVGYEMTISDNTLASFRRDASDTGRLYTYLHVREDAQELFGFYSLEEKHFFEMLISVSGVGPRAAMAVLSALSTERLAVAIISDDAKSISAAQGIGLRTAQKIILELKDKVKKDGFSDTPSEKSSPAQQDSKALDEALEALLALGYSRSEAFGALRSAPEGAGVEELIRHGLKNLTR